MSQRVSAFAKDPWLDELMALEKLDRIVSVELCPISSSRFPYDLELKELAANSLWEEHFAAEL